MSMSLTEDAWRLKNIELYIVLKIMCLSVDDLTFRTEKKYVYKNEKRIALFVKLLVKI